MHPDGVCQLPGGVYTKTVEYEDINYSVASTEDQSAIFGGWSSFLNYFDATLPFQLSFINRRSHDRSRYKVNIPEAEDKFNSIRGEFTGMLKNQIAKSNNGIERAKYITFGLPAEGVAEARSRLERVEADVMGNFKRLGVPSEPIDGRRRLAVLHGQMHPGGREPFRFAWQDIPKTGMGTKDFMAISKSEKIQGEIDKVKAKIAEQQARLKELEQNKREVENSEIVEVVRGMSIPLDELAVLLQTLKGGTSGQSVPKPANKEDSE
ncbi:hypothetical protein OBV_32450 [Oscillibacter valericigenes Sjm18-20]|nr:hypothetical protein OBV_32450 [Oscillibacter valericigenes Sjm18-20]